MKTVLILTCANTLKWVDEALNSLRDDLPVWIIEDGSTISDDRREEVMDEVTKYIDKPEPRGQTHNWNLAYRKFMESDYENCILSNDDVKFSREFSRPLVSGLEKFDLVGPLSNEPGNADYQSVYEHLDDVSSPHELDEISRRLRERYSDPYQVTKYLNGFCLAFSRGIRKFSFDDGHIVNPNVGVNLHQEEDLCGRIRGKGKIRYVLTSYVFHYKGKTMKTRKERHEVWGEFK